MRQRACGVATIATTIGLLLLGRVASATEHLFQAMGMGELPSTVAPDFTLPDLHGRQISLRDYRGKVVFLNFWATWCIPCREEMPAIEQLHRMFQSQGLAILAVNLKESPEQVKAFFDKYQLSFTALLDARGSSFPAYGVFGLPTTYLISRDGKLLARGVGGRDWAKAAGSALIRELLAMAPADSRPDTSVIIQP